MIPADSPDIRADYNVLVGELEKYNPELLDKKRILAVTKSDLLDEELRQELEKELPEGIPAVFISAITHRGIGALKDMIWQHLQG